MMQEPTADAIYDILEKDCAAPPAYREAFCAAMLQGGREFRFMGSLGFGGKVYVTTTKWYVACYRDEETPERTAAITKANERLSALKEATENAHVRSAS